MTELTSGIILAVMLAAAAGCALLCRLIKIKWLPATLCAVIEFAAAVFLLYRQAELEELFFVLLVFGAVTFGISYGELPKKRGKADPARSDETVETVTEKREAHDGI